MKKIIDREFIQREIEYLRVPGAAVAFFGEGFEDEYECFGYRDVEQQLPFTDDTVFCVASCSKSMTAGLIASLVAEGILDYDRPIAEYLPEFQLFDQDASANFTLRDMLCHRTGFGSHDVLWPCDRKTLAESIRYIEPWDTFRGHTLYSNVIYALIGYVAEAVTGRTWDHLMQEYIFDKVHMTRTTPNYEGMMSEENRAEPYYIVDGNPKKVPFWNIDGGGPAASVNTTIRDLVKWVKFNMTGGVNEDGEQVIPCEAFDEIHKIHMPYPDWLKEDQNPCNHYAMAWRVGEYKGYRAENHTGKIEGYSTLMYYLPEKKIGVVVMVNLHTPTGGFMFSNAFHILDRALGLEEDDWAASFGLTGPNKAPLEGYLDCYQDIAKNRLGEATEEKTLAGDARSAYIGAYASPGHGTLVVIEERREDMPTCRYNELLTPELVERAKHQVSSPNDDMILALHYRDQKLPLVFYGDDVFVIDDVLTDTQTLRLPVTFRRNKFGEVVKVYIPYEPETGDIVFIRQNS